MVVVDLSGMMLRDKFDRPKNLNTAVAPELMKHVLVSDMGFFYPDIVMVKVTDRADVFSLGILLFRMLMGDAPVLSLSYHSGTCKDQKCFKGYLK